ncbi:MAG TPA: hypothetical protein DEH78_15015 [Solibacterales bacterium]|nr:hypothetical protein [Bryobacterales bacterium]
MASTQRPGPVSFSSSSMLDGAGSAPPIVDRVVSSGGSPLDPHVRSGMETRFGHTFGDVRIHADARAAESATAVGALAYTFGRHVVFNTGQYNPRSRAGNHLLAHELAHVVQQSSGVPAHVQRFCSPAAMCPSATGAPVVGSAQDFGDVETAREAGPRARRLRMTPDRARASGHAGRALQLERFLEAQSPGRLANIQGVFIDWDLSPGTGALTTDCAGWIATSLPAGSPTPTGMAGAAKPCVFVHGEFNQQAFRFNTTADATIGGMSREDWRIMALQRLTHEVQHVVYDAAAHPVPAGVTSAGCTPANFRGELSELNAILSEFPSIHDAVPAAAPATDPAVIRLNDWFDFKVLTSGENISSIMTAIGCSCHCPEVTALVRQNLNFIASGWPAARTAALRAGIVSRGVANWPA